MNARFLTTLARWRYHARVMGWDMVWPVLLVAAGYEVVMTQAGAAMRTPAALTLWSEILSPALVALLAGIGASSPGDGVRGLVLTGAFPGWRVYLERLGVVLGMLLVFSLGIGGLLVLTILPAAYRAGGVALVLQVTLVSAIVQLLFGGLAVWAAEEFHSATAGGAFAVGTWLFFLLARILAYRLPWEALYPFLTFFHGSSDWWLLNRLILTVLGLLFLLAAAIRIRKTA